MMEANRVVLNNVLLEEEGVDVTECWKLFCKDVQGVVVDA